MEMENITISLPKKLLAFLKTNEKSLGYPSVKAYIEESIKQSVKGDIDNGVFNRQIEDLLNLACVPQAERKTRELPVDNATYAKLEARAKEKGLTVDQYATELVDSFLKQVNA